MPGALCTGLGSAGEQDCEWFSLTEKGKEKGTLGKVWNDIPGTVKEGRGSSESPLGSGSRLWNGYSGSRYPPEPTWENRRLSTNISQMSPRRGLATLILALDIAAPDLKQASHSWVTRFQGRPRGEQRMMITAGVLGQP